MQGFVSKILYCFEWSVDLVDKLLDSSRVGIGLDLNMIFENVANFEVLAWGEIIVMKFTMASVAFFDKKL